MQVQILFVYGFGLPFLTKKKISFLLHFLINSLNGQSRICFLSFYLDSSNCDPILIVEESKSSEFVPFIRKCSMRVQPLCLFLLLLFFDLNIMRMQCSPKCLDFVLPPSIHICIYHFLNGHIVHVLSSIKYEVYSKQCKLEYCIPDMHHL